LNEFGKVAINLPEEVFLASYSLASRLTGSIHMELKHFLFPSLRLQRGSPKPNAISTSRSFLKDQATALNLRYVWDPKRLALKLVGDFQVCKPLMPE
jgi:hypothetical protein